jgi:hypothetical protein
MVHSLMSFFEAMRANHGNQYTFRVITLRPNLSPTPQNPTFCMANSCDPIQNLQ